MTVSRSACFFLALFTGPALYLAFPGSGGFLPLLAVALVPLLFSLSSGGPWRAAAVGFFGGIIHFLLLLYWIIAVLGQYGGLNWFFAFQALLLLAIYLSVYLAGFAMAGRLILGAFPAALALWLLPALWVGIDWLRGLLFTGFPWMDLGYALYRLPVAIQLADLVGHHGLTFLIVLVNTLLVLLLIRRRSVVCTLALVVPVGGLVAGIAWYSHWRLGEVDHWLSAPTTERITVGIVQGNIDQSEKWSPAQQQKTVTTYLRLSESLMGDRPPVLTVWPETALPFYPPANEHLGPLKQMVAGRDLALLTGAPWYEILDHKAKKVKFFNSAVLLEPAGQFTGRYDKLHLVPFGEYVPLKKFLPFIAPLVEAVGDFTPGTIEKPLVWKGAKVGPLICFESVFPDLSRQWVLAGANVLVNLTNDAWYGRSSAPHHSLAMAVFRAVETRRNLVRSANTGISAFIDPAGRVLNQSPIFEPWAAAGEVALSAEKTQYVRFGHLFAPICLVIGLGFAFIAGLRRRG